MHYLGRNYSICNLVLIDPDISEFNFRTFNQCDSVQNVNLDLWFYFCIAVDYNTLVLTVSNILKMAGA